MPEIDRVMDEIEAELWTFQWANPDRGEANRGELSLDRNARRLCMEVWVLDNEDPGNDEVQPLTVSQDVTLEPARDQIRSLIHGFLCHEADEQMWFAGERPFYPHQEESNG